MGPSTRVATEGRERRRVCRRAGREVVCVRCRRVDGLFRTPVKTCAPLWTAATGSEIEATPAVVNGVVYVGAIDGTLFGFDAAGSTGCSGTPVKTCAPLWKAATGSPLSGSPAVANGVVYVGRRTASSTRSTRPAPPVFGGPDDVCTAVDGHRHRGQQLAGGRERDRLRRLVSGRPASHAVGVRRGRIDRVFRSPQTVRTALDRRSRPPRRDAVDRCQRGRLRR